MDNQKIGSFIQQLRRQKGMTQKELAEKLNITYQAVSKWETGESLPDTGLLLDLCEVLETSVDKLLNGGTFVVGKRKLMRVEDVVMGFELIEDIGKYFGESCTFYTGMIEGINTKMNIDLLEYLKNQKTREVMYAEVIIQGILEGKTVDINEVESVFTNKKMVETIRKYLAEAEE